MEHSRATHLRSDRCTSELRLKQCGGDNDRRMNPLRSWSNNVPIERKVDLVYFVKCFSLEFVLQLGG